jgi:hypothetical protein
MPTSLESLESFGEIAAEINFRPEFFVPSTAWDRVSSGRRPIAIGRKGSGKTALRLAMSNRAAQEPLIFAADLTFSDYPWEAHQGVFDPQVSERSRYVETWYFLMLVELAKLAVGEDASQPIAPSFTEDVRELRRFLLENWGDYKFDHREIFKKTSYRLEPQLLGNKIGSVEWSATSPSGLGDRLRLLNIWLTERLQRIIRSDCEYWLMFDELDLDFEPSSSKYDSLLVGLLLAVKRLYEWSRNSAASSVRIMLLLRDDIYDGLQFQDKYKITDSLVEEMRWSDSAVGKDSLKAVIDERIKVLLGASGDDVFDLVFGNNASSAERVYRYMVSLTYARPRDLIKFCNLALNAARQNRGLIRSVGERDVIAARRSFSEYLVGELRDEVGSHEQEWNLWLEVLRVCGSEVIELLEFQHQCRESPNFVGDKTPDVVAQILYRFSIVGQARVRKDRTVFDRWAYRDSRLQFDQDADFLVVHPGLCDWLGIRHGSVCRVSDDRVRRGLVRIVTRESLGRG